MVKAFFSLCLLLAFACGPCTKPREIVVAQHTEISTLDPHLANETVVWSTLSNVLEGLVRFSPTLEPKPALAARWEQLSPTTWRFTLRPGARFHNGKPCTSEDVVASLLRARNHPRSQIRHLLESVAKVEAEGTNKLTIETAVPSPTLLKNLVFVLVVPKEYCSQEELTVPIGTGPYRVVKREKSSVQLQGLPWQGRMPEIRRAKIVFIADDEERIKALLTGKVDVCSWPREKDLGEVRSRRDLRLVQQPRLAVQLLAITPFAAEGITRRALADVRVRRALLLAVDRERLVQEVAANNGTVASQLVHPLVFGYDPSVRPFPYDPAKARALLAEAGFAQGFEVEVGIGTGVRGTGQQLVQDWAQIGVKVHLQVLPFPRLMEAARAGRMQVTFFARTCITTDASEFLDPHTRCPDARRGLGLENIPRICDPQLDRLLDAASLELDVERRRSLLQQAQRRVLEQGYYLPLLIRWAHLALRQPLAFTPRFDQSIYLADFALQGQPL